MSTIAAFHRVTQEQFAADAAAFRDIPAVETIPLPRRATAGSAGYDFVTPVPVTLQPGESCTIPTGIRASMEAGWVLMIFPRSSLGFKHSTMLANTVGIIDSDYFHAANQGHIMVRLTNRGDHPLQLASGERFCQGIFLPYGLAQEEAVAGERTGGMGSTGK